MLIFDFKYGDIITRTAPSIGVGDRSYIGDKFEFKGIKNGCIHLHCIEHKYFSLGQDTILELDTWLANWEYWVDDKLTFDNYAHISKNDAYNTIINIADKYIKDEKLVQLIKNYINNE